MKSERVKKLESELNDLEQWMKLGLVPKNEIERHKEEIAHLKARIVEEKERLQFLKESGEIEEFTAPRRNAAKVIYPDTPSMSDVAFGETTEAGLEMETESLDLQTQDEEKDERDESDTTHDTEFIEEDEDPFSDKNRWRRGGIMDPDTTEW
ncbi:MAG: hypothetical protein R3E91_00045 [Chlamydiales bacterium]